MPDYFRTPATGEQRHNVPDWAWLSNYNQPRSLLEHVNRHYWMKMRQLNCLIATANWIGGKTHREAVQRIVEAEKRDVTRQFEDWKEANGYAASRA